MKIKLHEQDSFKYNDVSFLCRQLCGFVLCILKNFRARHQSMSTSLNVVECFFEWHNLQYLLTKSQIILAMT